MSAANYQGEFGFYIGKVVILARSSTVTRLIVFLIPVIRLIP